MSVSSEQIGQWNEQLAGKTAEEVIEFFVKCYGDKIALSSSLGLEDQVLTDMMASVSPSTTVFTLDTGRLFPETYELIQKTESRYKMRLKVYFPDSVRVEEMVNSRGINLFYESIENRKQCCHVRKIEPLKRAFSGLEAWICGLRRDQSVTRQDVQLVEWDQANCLIKINPLIDWSLDQVWAYVRQHRVPYNVLHDKGFPSIGCQPCTRAILPGEDVRAGRWWWENPEHKECGLHARKV